MTVEVLAALLGAAVTLILGLATLLVKLLRTTKPILEPNPHPDNHRAGDMATSYWDLRVKELGVQNRTLHMTMTAELGGKLDTIARKLDDLTRSLEDK